MAKEIIYVDKLSTVPRAEGAPQWYTRGDQIYRQDVDENGDLIPDHEEHYKWGGTPDKALKEANGLQLASNKKVSKTKKKKR